MTAPLMIVGSRLPAGGDFVKIRYVFEGTIVPRAGTDGLKFSTLLWGKRIDGHDPASRYFRRNGMPLEVPLQIEYVSDGSRRRVG